MSFLSRFLLGCGVLILWTVPASAQYMRLTTDNPADNTQLRPSGTTIVTVTLDTNHDRDGSLQTCNSHTQAACGWIPSGSPMDLFTFTLDFRVVGGTVQWGPFSFADPFFEGAPQKQNDTEVEVNGSQASITDPGLIVLGTLPVTIVSGAPTILPQVGPGALNVSGIGNYFWTHCPGANPGHNYLIGDPSDPCGATSGRKGDWFDFDGVYTGSPVTSPAIKARGVVNAYEGSALTIQVTATDPDASRILTITQSGMPADLTFTTDPPGPSPRTATVSGTPGFNDSGTYNIVFTVNDDTGLASASTVTRLVITNVVPTILDPIADMTAGCGATADQAIRATDADGDATMFSFSGPSFMTLTVNNQIGTTHTGNIHLSVVPAPLAGTYSASVTASSTGSSDTKSFVITVPGGNCPPVLNAIANMVLSAGDALDRTISAQDPNGDPLSFSKVSGPSFMTVTTTAPGTGTATGNIHLATGSGDAGSHSATVAVTDGIATDSKSFTITVCPGCAPTLDPIADMTGNERSNANQAIHATDPQGGALTFVKETGPTFMTVTTTSPGHGTASGNIHLAPDYGNAGTYSASVRVFNGPYSARDTFLVTVNPPIVTGITEINGGSNASFRDATVAPNPLNGDATVTFTMSRQGAVRIDLFSIQGRLVRRLVDDPAMPAGTHEAIVDGRGSRGEKLSSGVYYIRGTSPEGTFKHLVTILK